MTWRRAILLILLGAVGGCGRPEPAAPPATARGRVLFHGRPLAGGRVVFAPHPDRGPAAKPAAAEVDANGKFRLTAGGSPYLAAGWYRVALADPPRADGAVTIFPPALRRPDRSGLEREVVAGRDNVFEFHIELDP